MTTQTTQTTQTNLPDTQAPVGVGLMRSDSYNLAKKIALDLSASSLIPKDFQGKPSNCLIALNMANRIGADPFMVMQNMYIVHGTPGWSSQFLIATFNSNPKFSALRYEFTGKENTDGWACRAFSTEKATGEILTGAWVSIKTAKDEGWYNKNNSKWKTMPQQMLMYRAASWFIRTYAPEIAMGLHTAEEVHDTIDVTPDASGSFAAPQQPESEPDYTPLLDLMPADTNPDHLQEFVQACATGSNATVGEVIADAVNQIDGFRNHYTNWLGKQHPAQPNSKPDNSSQQTQQTQQTQQAQQAQQNTASAEEEESPSPQAQARAELKARREKLLADIKGWNLNQQEIEGMCNAYIDKASRPQLEKAEAIVAEMIVQEEQRLEAEMQTEEQQNAASQTTQSMPAKIQCPASGNIVRPAVECANCQSRNGCPEFN